jgi:hypothetical protein
MITNDKRMWLGNTNATYYPRQAENILRSLNETIHGLYALSNEESNIIETLNTTTYVEAEYKRLIGSIGIDLADIANKLEMIRSLLFGDCLNWDYICQNLKEIESTKKEDNYSD